MRELQQLLQAYLLGENDHIAQHVVSTEKVASATRLHIYRYAYHSRLFDALSASYPILQQYMGEKAFQSLAKRYIKAKPSFYRSIRWFGDELPRFLRKKYLSELAQLEWSMGLVFDSANDHTLTLEEIMLVPPKAWDKMRLQFHPTVHRLSLLWNVVAMWQQMTENKVSLKPEKSTSPVNWIFWRDHLTIRFYSLSRHEAWALNTIYSGRTFGELCEGLCDFMDKESVALEAASLLKGWIMAGVMSSFVLDS